MSIRKILTYKNALLRKKCLPVAKIDASLRVLLKDMFDTMYAAEGIGLAANQIGVNLAVAVIDVQSHTKDPITIINPKIISTSGKLREKEGCLSISGMSHAVERFANIEISALNENGFLIEYQATGLLCRAFQHEIGHLNGQLYIDLIADKTDILHDDNLR